MGSYVPVSSNTTVEINLIISPIAKEEPSFSKCKVKGIDEEYWHYRRAFSQSAGVMYSQRIRQVCNRPVTSRTRIFHDQKDRLHIPDSAVITNTPGIAAYLVCGRRMQGRSAIIAVGNDLFDDDAANRSRLLNTCV